VHRRRVGARIERTTQGLEIRYVVTNPIRGCKEWIYGILYCARGQAAGPIQYITKSSRSHG
jgi:hypothetical protein